MRMTLGARRRGRRRRRGRQCDDIAGEPFYEVACPACGKTVYVSEDDLDVGRSHLPQLQVAFEVALEDPEDDGAARKAPCSTR